jgi:hypothetical protein
MASAGSVAIMIARLIAAAARPTDHRAPQKQVARFSKVKE